MATPSKQIGWGTEENLLSFISKQLGHLTNVAYNSGGGGGGGVGPEGPPGQQGLQGVPGTPGTVGPAGLNWQGSWTSLTSYVEDDAVGYAGASWFCTLPTSGSQPPNLDTEHWALLASQGAPGQQGEQGVPGETGPPGSLVPIVASAPLTGGTITTTGTIGISAATISTAGYLTVLDWNKFNNKQDALGFTPYNATNPSAFIPLTAISATSPIFYNNTTGVIYSQAATSSVNGYLTHQAFTTFTNKEDSANKQNSLAADGTGTKFPTVDAVNAGISGAVSNVVTLTGNQSINGKKTFINDDTTLGGIKVYANKTTGGSTYGDGAGILISGTGSNYGMLIDGTFSAGIRNISGGSSVGIFSNNTANNSYGFYSQNTSTGVGIYSRNEVGGVGMRLENLSAATGKPFQYLKAGTEKFNILDNGTANYTTDLSSSYTDRTLVDKGYITTYTTAQLAGKMNNPSLTASYIPKSLTATTIGNSILFDTGTYLGINTINAPIKDITLGRQNNKVIGIEQSDSYTQGRNLIVEAGRTINFAESASFISNGQTISSIETIAKDPYNVIWLIDHVGNNYYKPVGSNLFIASSLTTAPTYNNRGNTMAFTSTNDLYLVSNNLLRQRVNNSGAWVNTGITCHFVAIDGNDVYIAVNGVDIYKKTNNQGSFVALGTTPYTYQGLMVHPITKDIYISTSSSILKLSGGTYTTVVSNSANSLFRSSTNDFYYANAAGTVYRQSGFNGPFINLGAGTQSNGGSQFAEDELTNIFTPGSGTINILQLYSVGISNLQGGTLKLYSGTGKGTGASDIEMWTGQVKPSGTDMQDMTLRAKINNEGLMTLPSVTNALIEADTTGKAVATKEYVGLAKSFAATVTATTTFTVTIGTTQANNTYKVVASPSNALSAVMFYINNKTTTTFDVVFVTALTGAVAFDWILKP